MSFSGALKKNEVGYGIASRSFLRCLYFANQPFQVIYELALEVTPIFLHSAVVNFHVPFNDTRSAGAAGLGTWFEVLNAC